MKLCIQTHQFVLKCGVEYVNLEWGIKVYE